jgi:hypothetical protein
VTYSISRQSRFKSSTLTICSEYIKSTGKDTVCRIEETKRLTQTSAIEANNQICNPIEKFEKWFIYHDKKLSEIYDKLDKSVITRGTNDIAIDSRGCRS